MKNKKIHKPSHIIRELKKAAEEKLPIEYYLAVHKYYKPFYEDFAGNRFPDKGDPEDNRRLVWMDVQKHPYNNKRAVKKIFKRYGLRAVQAWFYVKMNPQKPEDVTQEESNIPGD